MGNSCCGTREQTSTQGVTIGSKITWDEGKNIRFSIRERVEKIPIGTVCCFDNKSKKKTLLKQIASADITYGIKKIAEDFMPRIGVVIDKNGTVQPLHLGTATALSAQDLECVSLVDPLENTYVATTSLGVTHVFKINFNQPGCFSWGFLTCDHVAQGQLPVPPDESTNYAALNRTNIEATAVFKDSQGVLMMFWAGRGGVKTGHSWTRQAPFNPMSGMVDETPGLVQSGYMANVTSQSKWRTCSAIVVEVQGMSTHFYFSSVYDGTEDDRALDLNGDQTSESNKKVFKSVIARTSFPLGTTSIIARYEGIKVEALMKIEDAMGKVTHLLMGTDDDDLGSLIGVMDLKNVNDTTFADLGKNSETKTFITRDKWGTSGMAPGGAFAFEVIKNGRV
jgi:hypothetical protein